MSNMYGFENLCSSNNLSHHGIKGQKWGTRRFQKKDGTLTQEGKERYYPKYDKYGFMKVNTGKLDYKNVNKDMNGVPVETIKKYYNSLTKKQKKQLGMSGGSGEKEFLTEIADDALYEMMDISTQINDKTYELNSAKNADEKEKIKRSISRLERNLESVNEMSDSWAKFLKAGTGKQTIKEKVKSAAKEYGENWKSGADSIISSGKDFVSGLFGKKKKK